MYLSPCALTRSSAMVRLGGKQRAAKWWTLPVATGRCKTLMAC